MVDTYRLLRAVEIPVLQTYLSVIRPGPLLRLASAANSLSGKSKLLGPLLSMAGAALPIMHRFRASLSRRRRSPVSVEPLRAFDREVDDFLEKVLPELGITCRRSSEQLRWKFDQRPFGEHIALAARDRETGQLRGYAVTKIMQREGVARWAEVADVVAAPNDAEAFRMLLAESHYLAAERDVDFVRMRCSHPAFKPRLPFWLRHTRPIVDSLFVSCQNDQIRALMQSSHWHLTAMSSALVDYGEDELSSVGAVAAAANVGVSHA